VHGGLRATGPFINYPYPHTEGWFVNTN
jgi:hypothetical protein